MSRDKNSVGTLLAFVILLFGADYAVAGQPKDAPLPKGAVARLGSFGFRNHGLIASMALSCDGKFLATVSPDQVAGGKLWSFVDGIERRWFNYIWYQDVVFLHDGKTIVFCSDHDSVKFFDFETGKHLKDIDVPGATFRLAVSPDGNLLATLGIDAKADRSEPGKLIVCLYELPSGKLKHRIERKHEPDPLVGKEFGGGELDASIKLLAFTADGKAIAAASADRKVTLWETQSGEFVRELGGPKQPANRFAMSADGKTLAVAGLDGTIRGFELAKGKEIFKLSPGLLSVRCLAFSPDGKKLAIAGQIHRKGDIVPGDGIWDIATGKRLGALPTVSSTLLFTANGKTLICSDANGNIRLFDPETAKECRPHFGHDHHVWGLGFSPDGKTLVSEGEDRTIRFWGVKTARQTAQAEGYSLSIESQLVFSPDGRMLATRDDDNNVALRDPHNGKVIRTLRGHTKWVYQLAFSPDSKTLSSAERDGPTIVWEAQTGKNLREVRHRFIAGEAVTLSRDGTLLAVARQSSFGPFFGPHEWGVWDTVTGKDRGKFEIAKRCEPPTAFAFTPDKKSIICGTYDGLVLTFDAETGKETARNKVDGYIHRSALSPDGNRFAISIVRGPNAPAIGMYETKTCKKFREFPGDGYFIYALAWSPDGSLLASAGAGSAIFLWDVAKDRP